RDSLLSPPQTRFTADIGFASFVTFLLATALSRIEVPFSMALDAFLYSTSAARNSSIRIGLKIRSVRQSDCRQQSVLLLYRVEGERVMRK
ncbi:unnamed protein product, partial [Heterotrigona itama]